MLDANYNTTHTFNRSAYRGKKHVSQKPKPSETKSQVKPKPKSHTKVTKANKSQVLCEAKSQKPKPSGHAKWETLAQKCSK